MKMRLTGSPAEPRVIEFLVEGQPTVEFAPGKTLVVGRRVFPGGNLVAVKATAVRRPGDNPVTLVEHILAVNDMKGQPVPQSEISLTTGDKFYGIALTGADGKAKLDLPRSEERRVGKECRL